MRDRAKHLPRDWTIGREHPEIPQKDYERAKPYQLKVQGQFVARFASQEEARVAAWDIWDGRIEERVAEAQRMILCRRPARAAMEWLDAWQQCNREGQPPPDPSVVDAILDLSNDICWDDHEV